MNTKENHTMELKIITVKELATILKIGRDKAYALIKNPSFPAIRIGNRYIVTEQALSNWLVENQYKQMLI